MKKLAFAFALFLGGLSPAYGQFRQDEPQGRFPSSEAHNYAVASAGAAEARVRLSLAQRNLDSAVKDYQRRFETSAEYLAAVDADRKAHADYEAARAHALRSLDGDDKYGRVAALYTDMNEQIAKRRAMRQPSDELIAMANIKMGYSVELRRLEAEVLDTDAVRQARADMIAAAAKLRDLRFRSNDAIRLDPAVLSVRKELDQAKLNSVVASARLEAAGRVARQAVDYSYFQQRQQYRQPHYYPPFYGPGLHQPYNPYRVRWFFN